MAGTVNYADLYGQQASTAQNADPTSVSGPNQGSVAPASANVPMGVAGQGAAFTWLGFLLLLVLLRLLIHFGGEVA